MQTQNLPSTLVPSSSKIVKGDFTRPGQSATTTLATATYLLNHLVLNPNTKLAWIPKTATTEKNPTLVGNLLANPGKSAIGTKGGKKLSKAGKLKVDIKRIAKAQCAQLRYDLLVFALGGACWLLTIVMLHVIDSSEQDQGQGSTTVFTTDASKTTSSTENPVSGQMTVVGNFNSPL